MQSDCSKSYFNISYYISLLTESGQENRCFVVLTLGWVGIKLDPSYFLKADSITF